MGTTKNTLKMLTVFLTLTLTLTPNLTEYHHQVTVVKLVIARRAGGGQNVREGECPSVKRPGRQMFGSRRDLVVALVARVS